MKMTTKDLAAGAINEVLKKGISLTGEKECKYFASMIEALTASYKAYIDELNAVPIKQKDILENVLPGVTLTEGQSKALLRDAKQVVREINLNNKNTLRTLEKICREVERLSPDAQKFVFEED